MLPEKLPAKLALERKRCNRILMSEPCAGRELLGPGCLLRMGSFSHLPTLGSLGGQKGLRPRRRGAQPWLRSSSSLSHWLVSRLLDALRGPPVHRGDAPTGPPSVARMGRGHLYQVTKQQTSSHGALPAVLGSLSRSPSAYMTFGLSFCPVRTASLAFCKGERLQ